jgi:hypothetical protein
VNADIANADGGPFPALQPVQQPLCLRGSLRSLGRWRRPPGAQPLKDAPVLRHRRRSLVCPL